MVLVWGFRCSARPWTSGHGGHDHRVLSVSASPLRRSAFSRSAILVLSRNSSRHTWDEAKEGQFFIISLRWLMARIVELSVQKFRMWRKMSGLSVKNTAESPDGRKSPSLNYPAEYLQRSRVSCHVWKRVPLTFSTMRASWVLFLSCLSWELACGPWGHRHPPPMAAALAKGSHAATPPPWWFFPNGGRKGTKPYSGTPTVATVTHSRPQRKYHTDTQ